MDNETWGQTDEELVHLSLTHPRSFGLLIDRYEAKLRRYLGRLGHMRTEDLDDLLQETFMKAYQNLNEFDLTLKFSSWIYRIAHNETISFFRHNHARPEGHSVMLTNEMLETMASEINVVELAERADSRGQISESINKLDKIYREVVILKFFEDKSYEEISSILMIPPGTVATRLNRAKAKIAEMMNNKGYIHG